MDARHAGIHQQGSDLPQASPRPNPVRPALRIFRNFILPLSHDEVVHGKRSILGRMPGDEWQRFANLRAYYGFMFGHPGKKLLFMGSEFGQERMAARPFARLASARAPQHAGIQALVRDLNRLYRTLPALHELDCDAAGFEWLVMHDAERSVFAWLRKGARDARACCGGQLHPEVYRDYRIKVPFSGVWREILNTDSALYGGSNVGNGGAVRTLDEGTVPEVKPCIPPLAAIFLVPER